jgi:DNA replication protein DnaC
MSKELETAFLVSGRDFDRVEKPREVCRECGEVFNFERNADFDSETAKSIPDAVFSRFVWRALPHPTCVARSLEREKIAVAEKNSAELQLMLKSSGFPANVMSKTLATFRTDPENEKAMMLVRRWRPSDRYGFWLQGAPGGGKSHLMGSFVHRYFADAKERVPKMVWWSVPFLFDRMGKDFGRQDDSEPVFQGTLRADVLFLDDLGTQQGKAWETERLFQILDHRMNAGLPTFVTTNLASTELKTLLHERLSSRLFAMCIPITLNGRDGRRDILAERMRELANRGEGTRGA